MAIDVSKYESNSDLVSRDELLQNAKDNGESRFVLKILDPEMMGKPNRMHRLYDPDSVEKAIKKWAEENGKKIYTLDEIIERSREIAEEEAVEKSISIMIGDITDGMTEEQEKEFVERWKEYEKVLKTPGMMSMNNNEENENEDGGNCEMGALNDYEMDELEDRMNELKKVKDEYDKCDWLMDYEEDVIVGKSRLEKELGLFFDKWEMFRGLKAETKGKIKSMIYNVIKETRDEDGKVLKRYLYGFNKSKMMDVKRNDE